MDRNRTQGLGACRRGSLRPLGWMLLVAPALVAAGCLSSGVVASLPPDGGGKGVGLGRLSASIGGNDGSEGWSVTDGAPDHCISGEHWMFFGADFPDPRSGAVLRLVVDPLQGAAVRVFDLQDPERRSIVVRPHDCATFRYRLEPTLWEVNDYRDFRVELEVECELAGGARVKAQVAAAHCS